MPVYPMDIAGLHRELPICKVTDDLYIGAFICFGDAELPVACARDMLAMLEADSYGYLFTAEAKSIPLLHEMAKRPEAKRGMATLCIGVGMGTATVFEKC